MESWRKEASKAPAMMEEGNGDDNDEDEEEDEEEAVMGGLGFGENGRKRGGSTTMSRRRGSSGGAGAGGGRAAATMCQAEGCGAELAGAKPYHRRHRVCEFHAKATFALVAGSHQRFCQQCSRFHELPEFDETKRSCRRRLAGHNERRRKSSLFESRQPPTLRWTGGGNAV